MRSRLTEQLEAAEAKANDAEAQLQQERESAKSTASRLATAVQNQEEAEQRLKATADEKRSLLERCLEAEAELERNRASSADVRRKLDDAQAALQELGRENQSIQVRKRRSNFHSFPFFPSGVFFSNEKAEKVEEREKSFRKRKT